MEPVPRATAGSSAASSSVKSAARTVELLELLAGAERPMTLAQVHRSLNYPKSSLHVLLRTLIHCGWVQLDASGMAYSIGVRALLAGTSYLEKDLTVRLAGPILSSIRDEVDETVHLARLDQGDVVYLASRESAHHLRTTSRVGRRLPAYACALGKVLLAVRSDDEARALLPEEMSPLTPHTLTSVPDLLADLAETRLRGYAVEHEENTPGLGCVAVAIPRGSVPTDAFSCSVPLARLSEERQAHIVDLLTRRARELAEQLGRSE